MKAEGRVFRAWEAILQMRATLYPTWAHLHGLVAPLWWAREHLPSNCTHTIEWKGCKELKSVNEQSLRKWVQDRWEWERRAADVAAWQSICRQVPQWAARRCTSIIAFLDTSARGDRWVNCPAKCVFLPFFREASGASGLQLPSDRRSHYGSLVAFMSDLRKIKTGHIGYEAVIDEENQTHISPDPRVHTASCSRDNTATSARNCREIKAAAYICACFYLWIHLPAKR